MSQHESKYQPLLSAIVACVVSFATLGERPAAAQSRGTTGSTPSSQPAQTAASPGAEKATESDRGPGRLVEEWQESKSEISPLRAVARMVDDKIEGECRFFSKSGKLYKVETYKRGVLHGPLTRYYPNGNVYFVAQFREGTPMGNATWYPDGTPAGRIEFRNGQPNGTQVSYFRNGRKCVEGTRVDGLAQGRRNHYLPDGRLFGVSLWKDDQQVNQNIIDENVTEHDFAEITKVTEFMQLRQADFWRAMQDAGPDKLPDSQSEQALRTAAEPAASTVWSVSCPQCGGRVIGTYDSYDAARRIRDLHNKLASQQDVYVQHTARCSEERHRGR